jgi:hypothetical protein
VYDGIYLHSSIANDVLQTNAPKNIHNSDPLNVRDPILLFYITDPALLLQSDAARHFVAVRRNAVSSSVAPRPLRLPYNLPIAAHSPPPHPQIHSLIFPQE